ncbi:MAG: glutamine-hydrolyzing GMP synthase, partial [Thermoguttaceae bacterium]
MPHHEESILILDFGSQYIQLIARRVREAGVYSTVVPYTISSENIKKLAPKGIILSGGPSSVYRDEGRIVDPAIFDLGIPVLGICYGMQVMARHFGASVQRAPEAEYGRTTMTLTEQGHQSALLQKTAASQQVWMSHADHLTEIPANFDCLATSPNSPVCAMQHRQLPLFGVQFHPEVVHSQFGPQMFAHFLQNVCHCQCAWNMKRFASESIEKFRNEIGDGKVICGLSGGVDSAVVAAILAKAIGKQLKCIL